MSASVHRSTDGTRIVNYLQWETGRAPHGDAALGEFQAIARRFSGVIEFEPHEFEVAHVADAR